MPFVNEANEFHSLDLNATTKLKGIHYTTASVNPASLAATTSAETAVTIPGVEVGDIVLACVPASLANDIALSGTRVSAANTVQLRLSNIDNTNAIDDTARTWEFIIFDLT